MLSIDVKLGGLEELKNSLNGKRLSSNIKKSLGNSVNEFHSVLQFEVVKEYQKPNGKTLQSVREGSSSSLAKTGANFIRNGLEYNYKPVPLHEFPNVEKRISVKSRYRLKGSFRVRDKNYADEVYVKVRKRSKKVSGRGFGGFKIKGGRRRGIFERNQKDTWTSQLDERAPIRLLFGLSLSQMANGILNRNPPSIKRARNKIVKDIFKEVRKL